MCAKSLQSCPILCDPMATLSMGFSRRILELVAMYSSRGLPDPAIEPTSLTSPALAGRFFTTNEPGKPIITTHIVKVHNEREENSSA